MVRIRRISAAVAVAVVLLTTPRGAHAQALQRLSVQSFTLSADTSKPRVDVPFHLVVSLRVRERVMRIDNLELPILAELELLGDERRLTSEASGTQYRETITVVAHQAGAIALAPATLQAIDARDGRAKQWFTNGLTLRVAGGNLEPLRSSEQVAGVIARLLLHVLLWIVGILCAVAVIVLLFRRRRRLPAAPVPPPPDPLPPVVVPQSRQERLRDALTVLRADPTRQTAVRVRSVLWRMVGASDGETLDDVLVRPEAADPGIRELLRALERAAFTYDEDLSNAITDACIALERYLA